MFSKITIIGNLGQDPALRFTPHGIAVVSVGVAANRKWKDSEGNEQKETTWHRVTFWRKTAEVVAEFLKKGSKVFIEGRLVPDPATGGPRVFQRKDGTYGAAFEVTALTVKFLGTGNGDSTGNGPVPTDDQLPPDIADDEVPF